jgi:hypothetical protein
MGYVYGVSRELEMGSQHSLCVKDIFNLRMDPFGVVLLQRACFLGEHPLRQSPY